MNLYPLPILFLLLVAQTAAGNTWSSLWSAEDSMDDQSPYPTSYDMRRLEFLGNATHLRIQVQYGVDENPISRMGLEVEFRTPTAQHVVHCSLGASTPLEGEPEYCTGYGREPGEDSLSYDVGPLIEKTTNPGTWNITFPVEAARIHVGSKISPTLAETFVQSGTFGMPVQTEGSISKADEMANLAGEFQLPLPQGPSENTAVNPGSSVASQETPISSIVVVCGLLVAMLIRRRKGSPK